MTLEESIKHCEEVADYDCFTDEQRKCSENDHQEKPGRRIMRPTLTRERAGVQKAQDLIEHLHDILPVHHTHGKKRSEMEQHIEKHMAVLGRRHVKQVVENRQVSRRGDRQKLGNSLDQTKDHRIEK